MSPMPIEHYGVVKGHAIRRALDRGSFRPHYHLLVQAAGAFFHAAVNVRSALDRAELLCYVDDRFEHPHTELWQALSMGFTSLRQEPESGAIDFIRGHLVDRRDFRVAQRNRRGQGGLPDLLDVHTSRAISDPNVLTYAFGARWGPKPREIDRTFPDDPILPSDGVHNVHMNQGSQPEPEFRDGKHRDENGPWQDGALLFHDTGRNEWSAIFLAFQSQHWQTDE